MSVLNHYLSMLVFAAGLLLGVQLPNWVNQYVQRVDAHFQEAKMAIQPYQQLADRLFDGSMERLIEHHNRSTDTLFKSEAEPIQQQLDRYHYLLQQQSLLSSHLWQQISHLILHLDMQLARETNTNYQATIPLHTNAIVCGLAGGVLMSMIYELLRGCLGFVRLFRRNKPVS